MLDHHEQTALTTTSGDPYAQLAAMVCNGVQSENTKRAYRRAVYNFFAWHATQGRPPLSKATVQAYVSHLRERGAGAATINQQLAAIRKLIDEAEDNNLIDRDTAASARRVKGERKEGKRLGNWMDQGTAQDLLNLPDTTSTKGLRDRALLAVLLGCGLRRSEAAALTVEHIQQREGRWVIVDLVGKRNKTRSVPMPSWCKTAVDAWTQAARITSGRVFRSVNKGDRLQRDSMTAQAVFDVVASYAEKAGLQIAPHDLRRTFAKLARRGGADLKQIQLSLGHASVKTTEVYLGEEQNLTDSPCDRLGLNLIGG